MKDETNIPEESQSFMMSILDWGLDVKVTNFEVKEDAEGGYLSFDVDYDTTKLLEIGTTHEGVNERVGELMLEAIKQHIENNE